MTARSLFNIILKVLGIFFIKEIVVAIPAITATAYSVMSFDAGAGLSALVMSLFILIVYGLLVYFLVFRTNWVIDILKLDEDFPEDPIPLQIHRSTILSITFLVVGVLMIALALPHLVRELIGWYRHIKSQNIFLGESPAFEFTMLFVYLVEFGIGIIFLIYYRPLVNLIELKNRRQGVPADHAD